MSHPGCVTDSRDKLLQTFTVVNRMLDGRLLWARKCSSPWDTVVSRAGGALLPEAYGLVKSQPLS